MRGSCKASKFVIPSNGVFWIIFRITAGIQFANKGVYSLFHRHRHRPSYSIPSHSPLEKHSPSYLCNREEDSFLLRKIKSVSFRLTLYLNVKNFRVFKSSEMLIEPILILQDLSTHFPESFPTDADDSTSSVGLLTFFILPSCTSVSFLKSTCGSTYSDTAAALVDLFLLLLVIGASLCRHDNK